MTLNILSHEYDVIEFDAPWAIAVGHEPLNRLVSEIFSRTVANGQTDRQ